MNEVKIINEDNIERCLNILKKYFNGIDLELIANVAIPNTIEYKSNDWLYYIFYSCLLDYGMKSKIYHKNLINTFNKYPNIFNPKYVVKNYTNKENLLLDIIKSNIHPRYPNIALKKWISLSNKLSEYDNLLELIQSFDSVEMIESFVYNLHNYGQKTGGLLIRLIVDSNVCKFKNNLNFIPLDRHDLEISYLNGIVNRKNLSNSEISELSTALINSGKGLDISPSSVDKYLWEIGNSFCNKKDCLNCPLNVTCKAKL